MGGDGGQIEFAGSSSRDHTSSRCSTHMPSSSPEQSTKARSPAGHDQPAYVTTIVLRLIGKSAAPVGAQAGATLRALEVEGTTPYQTAGEFPSCGWRYCT